MSRVTYQDGKIVQTEADEGFFYDPADRDAERLFLTLRIAAVALLVAGSIALAFYVFS